MRTCWSGIWADMGVTGAVDGRSPTKDASLYDWLDWVTRQPDLQYSDSFILWLVSGTVSRAQGWN
jgi:hypothetical protein